MIRGPDGLRCARPNQHTMQGKGRPPPACPPSATARRRRPPAVQQHRPQLPPPAASSCWCRSAPIRRPRPRRPPGPSPRRQRSRGRRARSLSWQTAAAAATGTGLEGWGWGDWGVGGRGLGAIWRCLIEHEASWGAPPALAGRSGSRQLVAAGGGCFKCRTGRTPPPEQPRRALQPTIVATLRQRLQRLSICLVLRQIVGQKAG